MIYALHDDDDLIYATVVYICKKSKKVYHFPVALKGRETIAEATRSIVEVYCPSILYQIHTNAATATIRYTWAPPTQLTSDATTPTSPIIDVFLGEYNSNNDGEITTVFPPQAIARHVLRRSELFVQLYFTSTATASSSSDDFEDFPLRHSQAATTSTELILYDNTSSSSKAERDTVAASASSVIIANKAKNHKVDDKSATNENGPKLKGASNSMKEDLSKKTVQERTIHNKVNHKSDESESPSDSDSSSDSSSSSEGEKGTASAAITKTAAASVQEANKAKNHKVDDKSATNENGPKLKDASKRMKEDSPKKTMQESTVHNKVYHKNDESESSSEGEKSTASSAITNTAAASMLEANKTKNYKVDDKSAANENRPKLKDASNSMKEDLSKKTVQESTVHNNVNHKNDESESSSDSDSSADSSSSSEGERGTASAAITNTAAASALEANKAKNHKVDDKSAANKNGPKLKEASNKMKEDSSKKKVQESTVHNKVNHNNDESESSSDSDSSADSSSSSSDSDSSADSSSPSEGEKGTASAANTAAASMLEANNIKNRKVVMVNNTDTNISGSKLKEASNSMKEDSSKEIFYESTIQNEVNHKNGESESSSDSDSSAGSSSSSSSSTSSSSSHAKKEKRKSDMKNLSSDRNKAITSKDTMNGPPATSSNNNASFTPTAATTPKSTSSNNTVSFTPTTTTPKSIAKTRQHKPLVSIDQMIAVMKPSDPAIHFWTSERKEPLTTSVTVLSKKTKQSKNSLLNTTKLSNEYATTSSSSILSETATGEQQSCKQLLNVNTMQNDNSNMPITRTMQPSMGSIDENVIKKISILAKSASLSVFAQCKAKNSSNIQSVTTNAVLAKRAAVSISTPSKANDTKKQSAKTNVGVGASAAYNDEVNKSQEVINVHTSASSLSILQKDAVEPNATKTTSLPSLAVPIPKDTADSENSTGVHDNSSKSSAIVTAATTNIKIVKREATTDNNTKKQSVAPTTNSALRKRKHSEDEIIKITTDGSSSSAKKINPNKKMKLQKEKATASLQNPSDSTPSHSIKAKLQKVDASNNSTNTVVVNDSELVMTEPSMNSLTLTQLKELCRRKNLIVSGVKKEVIARILFNESTKSP